MAKSPTYPTLFDEVKRISICKLREWQYLEGYKAGVITWSRNDVEVGRISIAVNVASDAPYLALSYMINDEPINYRVPLIRIPSNLGKGVVWYFLCPHTLKRCRVLYMVGKRFLHRDAFKGMYECQTYSKKWRNLKKVFDWCFTDKVTEALAQKHFRTSYNGKPTKKFKRLMDKTERKEMNLARVDIRQLLG
jgi:hypothetical protein